MAEERLVPSPAAAIGAAPELATERPSLAACALIVDDNDADRYAVGRMLGAAGFAVREAASGGEALAQITRERPDIVILDVHLPDMNGFEVLRRIRANADTATIPVLHLSASYTSDAFKVLGLETGADAYLTHPVEPPVLVATLRALLRVRAAEEGMRVTARQWQETFDAIGDAVVLLDGRGGVVRANAAALGLLGGTLDEIVGRTLHDLVARRLGGTDAEVLRGAGATREPTRHELRLDDHWFQLSLHPVRASAAPSAGAVAVLSDITERRALEEERARLLEEAEALRAEAEHANLAKTHFLRTMSHELRTPLNAIGGYVDLLDMGLRGPVTPEQQQDLARIRRSQKHLLGLINDVLNFARIETGHVALAITDVPVAETLAGVEPLISPQLQLKGIHYVYDRCDESLVARADVEKLRQIVLNLLSNAQKFTDPGGTVTLTCEAHGSTVAVRVRDTGCGIPPDRLDQIFEPFVQIDRTFTNPTEGTGLGLAISRELARAMGGDLTVESLMGTGSTFTLWLQREVA